jgi:hypothetical protein
VHRCSACGYLWRPCSDPFCMGFRIVDLDTDPAIRGCSYCDLERGGISDDVARSFAAARRAFWRAHDELEKSRAEQDAAAVHGLVEAARRDDHDGDFTEDDDEAEAEAEDQLARASHAPRRPSSLPPRRRSGTGSASRRVRFRRA